MNERERAIAILGSIPEADVKYVLAYLQGFVDAERADDAFCEQLYQSYLSDPDKGNTVSFEDVAALCGVNADELQD